MWQAKYNIIHQQRRLLMMQANGPVFLDSTNSFCFISERRHYYVSGKGITQALLEMQLRFVSRVDSGMSSKLYKNFINPN